MVTDLFVGEDIDVTLDALLPHVGPAVTRHPLALTLRTLVLPKAALLALVRRQPLAFGPSLPNNHT